MADGFIAMHLCSLVEALVLTINMQMFDVLEEYRAQVT
jgi:hypothetical protein